MTKKPNIILITIDCLRADYCGWLNPEKKELTPFLNKLAKESIIFTNAYSCSHLTFLSGIGFLTGTYPLSFEGWDKKTRPALDQRPYLPQILKENGYFTVAIHDLGYFSSYFGFNKGFDLFLDLGNDFGKLSCLKFQPKNFPFFLKNFLKLFLKYLIHFSPKKVKGFFNFLMWVKIFRQNVKLIKNGKKGFATAEKINEKFFKLMKEFQNIKSPFFIWIHYGDLHEPYFFPSQRKDFSEFSEKKIKKANIDFFRANSQLFKKFLKEKSLTLIKKLYQLNLRYLDKKIEEVFNFLKTKFKEGFVIFITADHGQLFGEEGSYGHRTFSFPKELFKVPLIIKIPSQEPKIIEKTVSLIQIPATILELSGIQKPKKIIQVSLLNEKDQFSIFSEALYDFSPLFDRIDLNSIKRIKFN